MPTKTKEKNKLYTQRYYSKNKEWFKQRENERRAETIAFIRSLKTVCIMCGFDNPLALEFHHRNPKEKEVNIGAITRIGWGKERILKEISKCEVLCANCHRIVTLSKT